MPRQCVGIGISHSSTQQILSVMHHLVLIESVSYCLIRLTPIPLHPILSYRISFLSFSLLPFLFPLDGRSVSHYHTRAIHILRTIQILPACLVSLIEWFQVDCHQSANLIRIHSHLVEVHCQAKERKGRKGRKGKGREEKEREIRFHARTGNTWFT